MSARERPGALALVLHSHMPYVEGFGTWPFGEEWLWEAVACVYLPLLDLLDGVPVTVGLTPVLCDQLEAMRGEPGERYVRFLREIRAPIHAEDAAGLEAGGESRLADEVRRAAGDYTRAERAFEERGRDLVAAFRALDAGGAVDLGGHARAAAADGHGRRPAAPAGHRERLAHAPLRRLGGRLLAARVRLRARARARARRPRRARLLRGPDSVWTASTICCRSRPSRGRWRCRSTGRRCSSSGTTRTAIPPTAALPQLLGPHGARPASRGATPASPTTTRRRSRSRASTRATSSTRVAAQARARRPALLRARHRAARPLVVRGPGVARRGARGGRRRRACGSSRSRRGSSWWSRSSASSSPSTWGHGKDFTTWDAPPVAELAFAARRRRAADGGRGGGARRAARRARARRPRAARDAGERLVVHGHARPRRRLSGRGGWSSTARP